MGKVTVVIDPGHGGRDSGATGNGLKEKDLTLTIALLLGAILKAFGVNIIYTRTTDVYVSLSDRAKVANDAKADLFISIHINAGGGITANGVEIFSHPTSSGGMVLSKDVLTQILADGIFKTNRGNKIANFAVLRLTHMSAVLTETGFIDHVGDAQILRTKQREIAESLAKGILKNLGIEYKEKEESKALYKVQVGAFSVKDNADKLLKDLADKGFKGFIVAEGATDDKPVEEVVDILIYSKLLRHGDRGDDVKKLQNRLTELGFDTNGVDGIFGNGTTSAVKSFQSYNKLTVDGIVGQSTIDTINNFKGKVENNGYYKKSNTYVIEVDPMDLKISVQDKMGSNIGLHNFVTGGYQWHHANGSTYSLGILASDNRGISNRQPHNKPAGTLLVHRDGSVAIKDIADLSKESMVRFAVSGCSILPEVKMTSGGFVGTYADIARKADRPMIGYRKRDNKIIIAVDNCTIYEGRDIMKSLGCDEAITLDAGGSAILKVDNQLIKSTTRRLHSVITW